MRRNAVATVANTFNSAVIYWYGHIPLECLFNVPSHTQCFSAFLSSLLEVVPGSFFERQVHRRFTWLHRKRSQKFSVILNLKWLFLVRSHHRWWEMCRNQMNICLGAFSYASRSVRADLVMLRLPFVTSATFVGYLFSVTVLGEAGKFCRLTPQNAHAIIC